MRLNLPKFQKEGFNACTDERLKTASFIADKILAEQRYSYKRKELEEGKNPLIEEMQTSIKNAEELPKRL